MTSSTGNTNALAELIVRTLNPNDQVQFERVYEAAQSSPILCEKMRWLLGPIEIDSEHARTLKDLHERQEKFASKHKEVHLDPPPKERVARCLERIEGGDVQGWWRLNQELTLELASRYYGSDFDMDITEMPGWSEADDSTRVRILTAAERFLREAEPVVSPIKDIDRWRLNLSGYRAWALLKKVAPNRTESLASDVWRKWAPILTGIEGTTSEQEHMRRELVGVAYRHAPGVVTDVVEHVIRRRKRTARDSHLHLLDRLELCWGTPELRDLLVRELTTRRLSPTQMESILGALLKHEDEEAFQWALRQLRSRNTGDAERRNRVIAVAKTLILYQAERAWPWIWASVQKDDEFGKALFLAAASEIDDRPEVIGCLGADALADLFIWLESSFPHAEDERNDTGEARWVTPRDSIAMWRDRILRHLAQTGTPDSVAALRRCERAFPGLPWIRVLVVDGEREVRRNTWVPLKPAEVLKLTQVRDSQLVQSTNDLMVLIGRCIELYQEQLFHQPAATAARLWHKQAAGSYRPIDENDLSDHLKEFLEQRLAQRGVVVNREVQISRRPGTGIGDRTDIQIDAIRRNLDGTILDVLTVAVELKGCWNRELETAIRAQLVGNYMTSINAVAGIYLVGWFPKLKWDSSDPRRAQAPDWDVAEARAKFDGQADQVSHETGRMVTAIVVDCGF